MQVLAVCVGLPRQVTIDGRVVATAIYKQPVSGRTWLHSLHFEGDAQADPKVHGGRWQAAYVYPGEHYADWRAELPGMDLPWGAFGENLATQGLVEADVHVGDALRIGRARVRVTSPRLPCFKLGHRFGDPGMLRRFLASGRTGFYLQVVEEGDVGAGDAIEILERDPQAVSIADFVRLHRRDRDDAATLRRLLATPHLPDGWRRRFAARLEEIDA